MKLKRLKESKAYATGTSTGAVLSDSDYGNMRDLLGIGSGTTGPGTFAVGPDQSGDVVVPRPHTTTTTPGTNTNATTIKASLTDEDFRRMAEVLARQATANIGNAGTPATDTAEEPDAVELPEPAEELTTSQKILAWAKDNMLIVGIVAAVIIYIMYRRAQ